MTMHVSSRPSQLPHSPAGSADGPGRALPHSPQTPAEDAHAALFDVAFVRELFAYGVGSLRRHHRLALSILGGVFAIAAIALAVVPRTYGTEAKLLAERNLVMPVLGNPNRNLPSETDTPTRLATEAIMNHTNLAAIVNATDLVSRWHSQRSPLARLKDRARSLVSGPPSHEEEVDQLVWTLQRRLWVTVGEGTVTIGVTWNDPDMAYRIVQTAQENFFEERHTQELALISESINILEEHARDVNTEIRASIDSMAQVRAALAPRDRNPLIASLQRAAPSREVLSTQARYETVQRTIGDLEQFRNRRLAEMQATLADQRNTYGAAHPQIENTEQLIRTLSTDSPQLQQLRREEEDLRRTLSRLGAAPATQPGTSSADPLLATAALRGLERLSSDSLITERQQYARSRLRIAVNSYEELLARLDAAHIELQTARAAFKYKYGVIVPAQVSRTPIAPKASKFLGGGLVLGLLLAVFVAVGLDVAGGRVFNPWQIERGLGLPVLAEAPRA